MSIRSRASSLTRFAWPLCLLLVPALLAGQESQPPLGEREAAIEAALTEQTSLDFTDQPLSDVVEILKQTHKIQIQLDNKALADAGVGSDTTITRQIHDVKLSSALDMLLGELDLTYVIRDEVLLITTKTEAENMLSTRLYPVADLVKANDDDLVVGYGADFAELIDLVTTSVESTTWDETGGPGTIKSYRKSLTLVISQTQAAHREIVLLLESLREVDRRQAEQHPVEQAPVVEDEEGLQLKVYKLPAKWLVANAAASQGNPSAPAAIQPATTPASKPAEQKPATSPAAPMPQMGGGISVERINPAAAELAKAIPDLIEPASWDTVGGSGAIRAIHGTLVVRQTAEVHRQIRRLLQALN
ncbi:MAG TPA: hypothetical protein VMV69_07400 [Pirellulales bacterium]|nr:hypothetical protein [Pirellulales bacterium]